MSENMLEHLKKRGVYRNVICSRLGGGHKLESVPDNHYDYITISGGFAQAHLPVDSIREVARMLKPGEKTIMILVHLNKEIYLISIYRWPVVQHHD